MSLTHLLLLGLLSGAGGAQVEPPVVVAQGGGYETPRRRRYEVEWKGEVHTFGSQAAALAFLEECHAERKALKPARPPERPQVATAEPVAPRATALFVLPPPPVMRRVVAPTFAPVVLPPAVARLAEDEDEEDLMLLVGWL